MNETNAADLLAAWTSVWPAKIPVRFDMSQATLERLRWTAASTSRPLPPMAFDVLTFTVDDVPDGKVRVTYSDDTVEVIP